MYHFFRQLWLVLGVKLMEINSNLFSRVLKKDETREPESHFWAPYRPAPDLSAQGASCRPYAMR